MASKAKQRRRIKADVVTQVCSITAVGAVFLATRRFTISSELTLNVETQILGLNQVWRVRGWVVACSHRQLEGVDGRHAYQISLIFEHIPNGLRHALRISAQHSTHAYPAVDGAELFGLN